MLGRPTHDPHGDPIPNPDGASNDRHRLIRYAYGAEDGYCRMVADAYGAWTRMWHDIGSRLYVETGTLVLSGGGDDWGARSRASLGEVTIAASQPRWMLRCWRSDFRKCR